MKPFLSRVTNLYGIGKFLFALIFLFSLNISANQAEPVFQERAGTLEMRTRITEDNPTAKIRIVIGDVLDLTGREEGQVAALVKNTLENAFGSIDGWQVQTASSLESSQTYRRIEGSQAPKSEPPEATSLYLTLRVELKKFQGGPVIVKTDMYVFTYPGKALKGSLSSSATRTEATENDEEGEDELIRVTVKKLASQLAGSIDQFQ
jgi:hypothetical protein